MSTHAPEHADGAAAPKRMSLSQVVELLLAKGSSQSSSVSLTRNAKGETQIEVVIRTDREAGISSPQAAELAAQDIYDRLRTAYPFGAEQGEGQAS